MSFKNGDRSRAHRLRKAKIKMRLKTRALKNPSAAADSQPAKK